MYNNVEELKGSIWRKWDLQIHVPEAKFADQYKSAGSVNVWEKFLNYIQKSEVDVFGVTDYFSINGYVKLIEKVKNERKIKDKIFFPNIEFRMDISVNKSSEVLQCHLIFDNLCDIVQIKKFLRNLKLKNTKADGSACFCIEDDIKACGGYEKISVTNESLKSALQDTFGKAHPYMIIGIASGMGSCRATTSSELKKELSDSFDDFCDFFFGSEANRGYYLKEDRYENQAKKALPKAVIATSDCHSFTDCEKKLGNKFIVKNSESEDVVCYGFTWIKSDPTFEGLKQILYEPTDRVAFGYEKPEKKKSYFVVDKVRFIDNSAQDNFPSDYIEINPNLVTLVGGKSTGKSLLLYYIAKTIDFLEVEKRFVNNTNLMQYDCDVSPNFNFEVVWSDGESTFLKNKGSKNNERKILYIPQKYLNNLSEKNVKSKEMLNNFVLGILLQDEEVKEKYESNISQIKTLSKSIPASVNTLYQLKQEILEIEENIRQLGEEKGIVKYISQLQKEADEIKNKSGLSSKEIKDYEQLLNNEKAETTNIAILSEDKKSLALFKQNITQHLDYLIELKNEQTGYLSDGIVKENFIKEFEYLTTTKTSLLASVDKITSFIDTEIDAKKVELEKIKSSLTPFMAKVKLQDELSKKNEAIKEEQIKMDKISLEKKNLAARIGIYNKENKLLIESYKGILSVYDIMRNEFKKYDKKFEDISLNVSVGFNEERFNEEIIQDYLNRVDIKRCIRSFKWGEECYYRYDPLTHVDIISELFNSVVSEKIKTIKNKLPKDAASKILENYFTLDFQITYKEDSLDKMSPGKKGLVLLRLLIDLSNEEWPIVLDQPDDDLDNRSVYYDLVSFIKKKKQFRQIIIATHNPNLVVGTDAEEIIVANQEGQEKGRDNRKYKFEYVSGALENAFELPEKSEKSILYRKGIRQHVCEIL